MALIIPVKGVYPSIGSDCFIAANATVVGDVVLGERCSVWFNAVVRGDVNSIRIGQCTNIQDGVVIHCTYLTAPTVIGDYVNIGHQAMVHGCTLKNRVLIGMGAIVMDHAVVEDYVIVAAGAVVLEGTMCESGYLYAGVPAKKIKPISDEQRKLLDELPLRYVMYSGWFSAE
ncbi:gamma carbonic anhydrase family protein [Parapedobacter sp. ISTM3]|uniref:Carbonic anhydrase or acetyltransferase, isoleucine patch superfamily n=1 Tax=Parapedobacter luteus TaxID=623280 RepID=A0A1T5CWX3_9SPHI|nr:MULTISPECIES: gamma carbonic anhydrase family protein [Parapedobacter]MBK1440655.1 gamma carbonic anhydrase family protein [Parapedobacter sp. ISTM3]SKB63962.1 Carbonic anhydrase or acetyltransferase, isoleucine patch superfamily [Parapedobacter luteus]